MKSILIMLIVLLTRCSVFAQISEPVRWACMTVKNTDDTYIIHVRATLTDGWHIYASKQPPGSIVTSTVIKFKSKSKFRLIGDLREEGNKKSQFIDALDINQYYYESKVDFIQAVKIFEPSTSMGMEVSYMLCNDDQCLPISVEKINIIIK